MNYSYDPTKLGENGRDRMRLELGDTTFAPGELTAALCDEEYDAILGQYSSFKKAKIACLKAILMKWAHQVNTSIDGISYSFADRVKFWKQLLDDLENELSPAVPSVNLNKGPGGEGGHYFRKNLHANIWRF